MDANSTSDVASKIILQPEVRRSISAGGKVMSEAQELGFPKHAFNKQDGEADLDFYSAPASSRTLMTLRSPR